MVAGYLSVQEAAKRLGVSERTIRLWVEEGKFQGVIRLNPDSEKSPYRIPVTAVEAFEARRGVS